MPTIPIPYFDEPRALLGFIQNLPYDPNMVFLNLCEARDADSEVAELEEVNGVVALVNAVGRTDKAIPKALLTSDPVLVKCAHWRIVIPWPADLVNRARNGGGDPKVQERTTRQIEITTQRRRDEIALTLNVMARDAMRGTISISYDNGSTRSIDTRIPAAQKASTVAASWAVAATDIKTQIDTIRQTLEAQGASQIVMLIRTPVLNYILGNTGLGKILSDRAKDELWRTGQLTEFLGMTLRRYDRGYTTAAGTQYYLNAGEVQFYDASSPMLHVQAPPPEVDMINERGWYAKSFDSQDPSGVNSIIGHAGLVFPQFPRRLYNIADVTATS